MPETIIEGVEEASDIFEGAVVEDGAGVRLVVSAEEFVAGEEGAGVGVGVGVSAA